MDEKIAKELITLANRLRINCNKLKQNLIKNNKQIEFAYNPLDYAWKPHEYYLREYGSLGAKTIIMGMNPGHGMGNTGIPFGCPNKVKNYLKIIKLLLNDKTLKYVDIVSSIQYLNQQDKILNDLLVSKAKELQPLKYLIYTNIYSIIFN